MNPKEHNEQNEQENLKIQNVFEESLKEMEASDFISNDNREAVQKNKKAKILWGILAFCFMMTALCCLYVVVDHMVDFIKSKNSYEDIAGGFSPITGENETVLDLQTGKDTYPLADVEDMKEGNAVYPEDKPDPSKPVIPDLNPGGEPTENDPYLSGERVEFFRKELKRLQKLYDNMDVFGWIYVPGTNIDYPLVQAKDNDFYLDKTPYQKYNAAGSIFLDYRNDRNLLDDRYSIIYGHNISSAGTMFNRLLELTQKKNFDKIRYIYIYTEQAALKYEIFSCYITDYHNGYTGKVSYEADAEYLSVIRRLQNLSLHKREGITLRESDRVLMLYTCANTRSNDERCYVTGVLVGVGL